MRKLIIGFCIAFALVLTYSAAFSHMAITGWQYDYSCCGDGDCAMIVSREVKFRAGAYHWRGDVFPLNDNRLKQSKDNYYHACVAPNLKVRCLYVPLGGV